MRSGVLILVWELNIVENLGYKIFPKNYSDHPNEPYKWFKDIFESNTIYLSNPLNFNDPFDCSLGFDIENSSESALKDFFNLNNTTESNIKSKILSLLKTSPDMQANFNNHIRACQQVFAEGIGVYCLTKKLNNFPMWAHYGENHEGIAIGYDLNKISINNCKLYPIEYEFTPMTLDQEVKLTSDLSSNVEEYIHYHFCRKHNDWKYEEETRLIQVPIQNNIRNIQIEKEAVHSVYFGNKMTVEDMKSIIDAVLEGKFTHVKFYKMSIRMKSFDLFPIEI